MLKFLIKTAVLWVSAGALFASELTDIQFAELPGEKTEIRMKFDAAPDLPKGFTINKPARIVLDFADVKNALEKKKFAVAVGDVSSAVVVTGGGRTRLIVNLDNLVPYTTRVSGSELVMEVGKDVASTLASTSTSSAPVTSSGVEISEPAVYASVERGVRNIDFRRGADGEGKVIISLSNANVSVDIEEVASGVEVRFRDMEVPTQLRRKLDVLDFATPVSILSSAQRGKDALISIEAKGDYDYLAYQADNEYVVSVKPLSRREAEEKKKAFAYTGEKLSLNFQDIQVRSVLQLIADFTDKNLVASDTVTGSITLRLDSVPWDQALDIVLKAKGLDKRIIGNVLMVAPAAEIAERERQEIETQKQLEELAPMRTEYIRIRYANARELFQLFVSSGGNEGGQGGSGGGTSGGSERNSTGSILSERGQAIVDERTNSIILTDTEEKIAGFKQLVERVDIPIQQVMIEARIVIANNDFRKELGVRIAGDGVETSNSGNRKFELTGRLEGLTNADGCGPECVFQDGDGDGVTDDERNLLSSNLVDLGVFNPAGAFTANVIGSNFLLGLELSALQNSGFAEIVSEPKVITGDKQLATIESGTEVPYQEESASGGTTTAFKEAVLKLEVTPQITPDDRIIMDLIINQDSISEIDQSSGVPVIDVTQIETQVLVADGETVVLGGIYTTEAIEGETKIPLLGDIPFLGVLFRNKIRRESKREILIFVTPKILASDYAK